MAPNDGFSKFICRPCNRKFLSAESFRALAKASYDKSRVSLSSSSSPKSSQVQVTRKRPKDTSGVGASPHTNQSRPVAKCQTVGVPGRRLNFSVRDKCKIKKLIHICM